MRGAQDFNEEVTNYLRIFTMGLIFESVHCYSKHIGNLSIVLYHVNYVCLKSFFFLLWGFYDIDSIASLLIWEVNNILH